MRELLSILICFCSCAELMRAQTIRVPDRMTGQEVSDVLLQISQNAGRVSPMLDQLRPADWVVKGASETYVSQWDSSRAQLNAIQADMAALALHPEQMTECMKALFRIQAAHQLLASLMGGLRKYQNPALADLIEAVAAGDRAGQDRVQQYLMELATEKEQQLEVMNQEAQRCRAILSRQPAESARPARRIP